jgi:hypothetical protein
MELELQKEQHTQDLSKLQLADRANQLKSDHSLFGAAQKRLVDAKAQYQKSQDDHTKAKQSLEITEIKFKEISDRYSKISDDKEEIRLLNSIFNDLTKKNEINRIISELNELRSKASNDLIKNIESLKSLEKDINDLVEVLNQETPLNNQRLNLNKNAHKSLKKLKS